MHRDRAIEVLTLEVEQLSERKAALEAALLALMREKRRETDDEAKAFMAGDVGDAKFVHDFCAVCEGTSWTSFGSVSRAAPCGYTALCMSQVYEHQEAHPNAVWRFA
jgi:hypothetical protein